MLPRSRRRLLVSLLVLPLAACSGLAPVAKPAPPVGPSWDGLEATLWVQTSTEAALLSEATFAAATAALDRALAEAEWSALDQGPAARGLPPAVIADVDETMLDNSAYQVDRLRRGLEFDPESWRAWVEAASAPARPGAVAFARAAAERGVVLFYVTNRKRDEEAATRANLERAGFPLPSDVDTVLVEGERPGWGGDKKERREAVGRIYRVLLLLGDDLNDFVSARGLSLEARRLLGERVADRIGVDWFLFANPMYGSWRRALEGNATGLDADAARRLRASHLRGLE